MKNVLETKQKKNQQLAHRKKPHEPEEPQLLGSMAHYDMYIC